MVAIPGDLRLLHYGLSRDSYEAHRLLDRLGLLAVRPDEGRWMDNTKIEGYEPETRLGCTAWRSSRTVLSRTQARPFARRSNTS
jgi:hypothetical protein